MMFAAPASWNEKGCLCGLEVAKGNGWMVGACRFVVVVVCRSCILWFSELTAEPALSLRLGWGEKAYVYGVGCCMIICMWRQMHGSQQQQKNRELGRSRTCVCYIMLCGIIQENNDRGVVLPH